MGLETPTSNGDYELVELVGNVVFQDVDFSYDGKKQILHDVNLYADKGQKVAFVGATGAGKTTITNLINRFLRYPIWCDLLMMVSM